MKSFLTEARAAARALSILPGIKYNIFLELSAGSSYTGIGHYLFTLKDTENVFLDFSGKSLDFVELNNTVLHKAEISKLWTEGAISLPPELLRTGDNSIVLKFHNDYYLDGNGLHSCLDTDGRQYLYTQTEPFWANRIFPLFDQPDIKGHLALQAACPAEWRILANTSPCFTGSGKHFFAQNPKSLLEELIFQDYSYMLSKEEVVYFVFKPTPLLPTYLFGFAAGPFKEIALPAEKLYKGIPMSVFVRESLSQFASKQSTELFGYAVEGIRFYEQFFRTPFPFEKCDMVFCPEYTVGAMEYPGVITFNDYYIFREVPSSVRVTKRGETIVHELAHMWFGNLVTMKWWNDLWLNESFADFCSFLANAHISKSLSFPTTDSWTSFQMNKFWGYNEDQAETTHPIACQVESTEKADSIFDGITYSKGAAVVKQLYFLLGHENFSRNIANYFSKHKWSNATLDDFIREMDQPIDTMTNSENFLPIDLDLWNEMWIETAGLNEVQADWQPGQQGPSRLILRQSAVLSAHPTLRYHRLKVAFFAENGTIAEVKEVLLENKTETTVEFQNKNYKAVFPNFEDWAYIKVAIDPHSLEFFTEKFGLINSPLTELMIVRSMFEMVRDARTRSDKFVDFLLSGYLDRAAQNLQVFDTVIELLHEALWRFTPISVRKIFSERVFEKLFSLLAIEKQPDTARFILKQMIGFAMNQKDIEVLKQVFDGKMAQLAELGLEDKWGIVVRLFGSPAYSLDEKEQFFKRVADVDSSDLMKEKRLETSAMVATLEQRKELWEFFLDKHKKIPFTDLQASMHGFFSPLVDEALKEPFYGLFFAVLPGVIKSETKEYAKTFLLSGRPDIDDAGTLIGKYKEVAGNLDEKSEYFTILIRKIVDGLERKKKAIALYH